MDVGIQVEWTSQSAGVTKTKRGVIVAVVPPNQDAESCLPAGTKSNSISYGVPRDHESYLVQVGGSARLYWPRVKGLEIR